MLAYPSPSTSPAFIIDEAELDKSIARLQYLRAQSGCQVLYSIKALPLKYLLTVLQPYIDGFSVSSCFEAQLANEVLTAGQSLHLTTPGIRGDEVDVLADLCTHISFNSFSQQALFKNHSSLMSSGLRVNPKLSTVKDCRFDPCREHSKLGVSLNEITAEKLQSLNGIHLHTVFSQCDYQSLLKTVEKLELQLADCLPALQWINLGGGYLFKQISAHHAFIELVLRLREQYGLTVYIEPGKAVIGDVVNLVTTVVDCFVSDGKAVAILDSSVNHNPEVFEYQRQPSILESDNTGKYTIILAGSSCLAGDIFGEYRFNNPLKSGDKITFNALGAYSLVKANRFNGYNLPDIYRLKSGVLHCIKQYSYQEYKQQWEC